MPLTPGASFGPYRIIDSLGRGGMASVYKAYEAALDRYIALKVLPAEFLHDETFAERFKREAKLIAKLEHPNIVPIYAFGIEERVPWMAMRMVAGGAASSLLKAGRPDPRRAVEILAGVAAALDYAHSEGVMHRDVKPQNILLDGTRHVYLADFGIARMVEGSAFLTRGGIVGTPQYMAPEQGKGESVDHRCDIYALGIVAYEMFTGKVPFSADTPLAVLMKHVMDPIPIPNASEVPEPITRALLKCLDKDPAARWLTAMAFVKAVEQGLGAAPAAPSPVDEVTKTVSDPRPARPEPRAVPATEPARTARPPAPTTVRPSPTAPPTRAVAASAAPSRDPSTGADRAAGADSIRGPLWPLVLGGGALAAMAVGLGAWLVYSALVSRRPVETGASVPVATLAAAPPSTATAAPPSSTAVTPAPRAALSPATLNVKSAVAGAMVEVDGREPKPLPARLQIEPGRHQVRVLKQGCVFAEQWLEVAAGESRSLALDPQCAPSPEPARVAAATPSSVTLRPPEPTPLPTPEATPTPRPAPAGPRPGEVRTNVRDGLEYVWIPPGTFQMGCAPGDSECDSDEKPRHQVTLSRGFWLGRTEVTVAGYKRFASTTGRSMPSARDFNRGWENEDHPIVNVTWNDSSAFCEWSGARLPSEAEWEYAARGGREGLKYPWGDTLTYDEANYSGTGGKDRWANTAPVASFSPNGFGLFDMAGNVWEWVGDWYGNYSAGSVSDPKGPSSATARVLRGGSWLDTPRSLRVSARSTVDPGYRQHLLGLRCSRDAFPF